MRSERLPPTIKDRVEALPGSGVEAMPTEPKFDHIPNPHRETAFEPLKDRIDALPRSGVKVMPTRPKFDHVPNPHREADT